MIGPFRLVVGKSERKGKTYDALECGHETKSTFVQFAPGADEDVKCERREGKGYIWRRCLECGSEQRAV